MCVSITYSDVYLPEKTYLIEDFVKFVDVNVLNLGLSQEEVSNILKYSMGVNNVYIEDKKSSISIFRAMIEKYFKTTGTDPKEILYIIYSRGDSVIAGDPWSPDNSVCINVPYYLQKEFGMSNAQVFNIEQECTGTLAVLDISKRLLHHTDGKILHITGNFFDTPEKRLMGGMIVVSDGIAVMEIANSQKGLRLIDFMGKTDGSYSKVKELSSPASSGVVVKTGSSLMVELLRQNELTMNDVKYIIPQNISRNIWNLYCAELKIDKTMIFLDNICDGGHMGDVDILRNLTALKEKKPLNNGDYIILYGVGTGTSWNCALLQNYA